MDFDDLLMVTVELFGAFPDVLASYQERFPLRARRRVPGHQPLPVHAGQATYREVIATSALSGIRTSRSTGSGAPTSGTSGTSRSTIRMLASSSSTRTTGRPRRSWTQPTRSSPTTPSGLPRTCGPIGAGASPSLRYEAEDEHDEAGYIADEVERLQGEGFNLSDMAVFYRTNAMSRVIEDVLVRRTVPYTVVGSVKFYDRKEIKDAIAYLRAVNPADEVSLKRIINEPRRGIGDTTIAHVDRFSQSQKIGFADGLRRAREIPQLNARAQTAIGEFVAIMDHLREEIEDDGVKAGVESVLSDTGMLATLEAEQNHRGDGSRREPAGAGWGRLRVRDFQ